MASSTTTSLLTTRRKLSDQWSRIEVIFLVLLFMTRTVLLSTFLGGDIVPVQEHKTPSGEKYSPRVMILPVPTMWNSTQSSGARRMYTCRLWFPMAYEEYLEELADDTDWGLPDSFEHDECKLQYEWQKTVHATCNSVHELSLVAPYAPRMVRSGGLYLGHGGWRDVWAIPEEATNSFHVLKNLRLGIDFSERHAVHHQVDAQISERLSASPHVLDMYSYCGNSAVYAFADGRDLKKAISQYPSHDMGNVTKLHKVRIAAQITKALAEIHNVDMEGATSIAHRDLAPEQFVNVGGVFQINDFNVAAFIPSNETTGEICLLEEEYMDGCTQSPEEYAQEQFSAEKADVYALGNVFYALLTGHELFAGMDDEKAIEHILGGNRSQVPIHLLNSTNPLDQVLLRVIYASQIQNAADRLTAHQTQQLLESALKELDPDWEVTDPYNS